jgi:hypothetical protein
MSNLHEEEWSTEVRSSLRLEHPSTTMTYLYRSSAEEDRSFLQEDSAFFRLSTSHRHGCYWHLVLEFSCPLRN